MKTLRFELPVLAPTDVPTLLDLVTQVDAVIAASVQGNVLEVVTTTSDAGLVLREEIRAALAEGAFVPT